jgi:type III secretion protein D
MLGDEGLRSHHARLQAREDGTVGLTWLEAPGPELVLQPGEGVALGPVRIAIAFVDSPWEDNIVLRGSEGSASEATAAQTTGTTPAGERLHAAGPHQRRRLIALAGLAAGLGLCSVAWLAWPSAPGIASSPASPAPPATVQNEQTPSAISVVQAAIEPLGLGTRVRIEPDAQRGVRVQSAYLSREEAQALRTALARLMPPIRPVVLSPDQVQGQLDEALLSLDLGPSAGLQAVALGPGRFRIEGRVKDASQREQVLAVTAAASPWALELVPALSTDEERAQALLQALRDLRLAEVDGTWAEGRLNARVRIAPAALPQWERELALAVVRYPVPLRVQLSQVAPPTPSASLPFTLRSVMGGSMPFVTLADGRRLALDGQAEGWRLVAVRTDAVVFERRDGTRVTLER